MFDGTCEIRRSLITEDGLAQIDLKAEDGTFDWTWFFSTPQMTREVLAIALAAIISNKRVICVIADPKVPNAEFIKFGLVK